MAFTAMASVFDLDYRPASYFTSRRPKRQRLTDSEVAQLQRLHPALCGGEDLPDPEDGEVEIVRISFPLTVHGEVTSIRARRDRGDIAYSICDEYDSSFNFNPRWSRLPLTMAEVIDLIDTAEGDLDPPDVGGLVAAWDWRLEQGLSPNDLVGDVLVSSEFYLQLGPCYEARFESWLKREGG